MRRSVYGVVAGCLLACAGAEVSSPGVGSTTAASWVVVYPKMFDATDAVDRGVRLFDDDPAVHDVSGIVAVRFNILGEAVDVVRVEAGADVAFRWRGAARTSTTERPSRDLAPGEVLAFGEWSDCRTNADCGVAGARLVALQFDFGATPVKLREAYLFRLVPLGGGAAVPSLLRDDWSDLRAPLDGSPLAEFPPPPVTSLSLVDGGTLAHGDESWALSFVDPPLIGEANITFRVSREVRKLGAAPDSPPDRIDEDVSFELPYRRIGCCYLDLDGQILASREVERPATADDHPPAFEP